MFQNLDFMMQNNAFLTWAAALLVRNSAKSGACSAKRTADKWRFTFACWQTYRYINRIPNISKGKNDKISTFFNLRFHIYEQLTTDYEMSTEFEGNFLATITKRFSLKLQYFVNKCLNSLELDEFTKNIEQNCSNKTSNNSNNKMPRFLPHLPLLLTTPWIYSS